MPEKPRSVNAAAFEPTLIWRDGRLIPFAEATTHVLSHMSARGSQVFDVALAVGRADGISVFGLREHVTRFVQSADLMGMEDMPDVVELEAAVADTIETNRQASGLDPHQVGTLVVKLMASWDDPAVGLEPVTRTPVVYVAVTLLHSASVDPSDSVVPAPIRVKTAPMPKIPASILPPSMKVAAGYTPGIRHHLRAVDEGFDHVVFRTMDGDLAESVTSSVLVVSDRRIVVPPVDSVLDGITRRAVLDVAQSLDIPFTVRPVAWSEVIGADELFLCSTIRSVVPFGWLDDRDLDAPGPITRTLADAMSALLAGRHPLSDRWMTPVSSLTSA